ncbi:MAG: DUF6364 family protein [Balneolales bacterium]|nr:DUF6364 family protein [Balneolales bacterium]
MDTKLTLKLDKDVIEKAKVYASSQNRSLSGIVESYLRTLTESNIDASIAQEDISPFVMSMKTGVQIPATLDEKEEYGRFREDKFK